MGRGRRNIRHRGGRMAGRKAGRVARSMGMEMKPLPDVSEVVIRTAERELIITNPAVNEIESKDNTTFMVVADGYEEREVEKPQFSEDDVELICVRTGVDREKAVAALAECDGEVATAMVRLMS